MYYYACFIVTAAENLIVMKLTVLETMNIIGIMCCVLLHCCMRSYFNDIMCCIYHL